ncbi:MAG: hypothetical protein WBB67_09710 [bacterium]
MSWDRDLNPAEKVERLEKLDKTLEQLEQLIDKDLAINISPAVQNLVIIVSILVQFVKNHEYLFLSFFETYKKG